MKPLRRTAFSLALLAAIFIAICKAMDNITVHNFIVADDRLTRAFAYLIIGGWTGFVFGLLFSRLFGKRIVDENFGGIVFRNSGMHRQAIIAGAISAGSTLFMLLGNQLGDPSMLIALGSGTIIFTSIYDVVTKQAQFSNLACPVLLVFVGSGLAAFGGSLAVTLAGILFIFFLSNGLDAFTKVAEQKGVRASDGVNFFLWRFFYLTITGTVLAIVVSGIRGYSATLLETVASGLKYIPFIALTMFFVFLGISLRLVAMKNTAISIVLIVFSVQIVLGYPITLLGNWFLPGLFGEIPTKPWIWAVRLIGAILIIGAICLLQRQNLKKVKNVDDSAGGVAK